jgi:hypothetical protein
LPLFAACAGVAPSLRSTLYPLLGASIMKTRFLKGLALAFLVGGGWLNLLAEPQPVWRIDLRQFGDKLGACNHPIARRRVEGQGTATDRPITTVRFWSHYLVVDMVPRPVWVWDKNETLWRHAPTDDVTPCPRLVFDLNNRQLVPKELVADAEWSGPQMVLDPRLRFDLPLQEPPADQVYVLAQWKNTAVVLVGDGIDLYLEEPGKERTLLYKTNVDDATRYFTCLPRPLFLGADRIGIDKCGFPLARYRLTRNEEPTVVVDKSGKERYQISNHPSPSRTILNSSGTRFAVYGPGSTGSLEMRNWLFSRNTLNWISVEVFDSDKGRKVFQYHWSGENDDYLDDKGWAALSDDGSLLAVIKDSEVLVFSVPDKGN